LAAGVTTGGNGICPARFSAAKTIASFMFSLHPP
jgi:hypothetical protein